MDPRSARRTQTSPGRSPPLGGLAAWIDSAMRNLVMVRLLFASRGPSAARAGSMPACSAVGSSWRPPSRRAPRGLRWSRRRPERSHQTRTTARRSVVLGPSLG